MKNIPVTKYHGCGNDFIIVHPEDVEGLEIKDLIVSVCDRHTGIGADGFIIVQDNPLEMVYYNQDGSRAPMCGNGIRCFAKFCFDEKVREEKKYPVETLAGQQAIDVQTTNPFFVKVNMGYPNYDDISLIKTDSKIWKYPLEIDGTVYELYSFFMGTIHTMVFVDDVHADCIEKVGHDICHHPIFKEQTNVNFVHVVDERNIELQTYERGCGMTLACGTGACASAVLSHQLGFCIEDIDVQLAKGKLHIHQEEDGRVFMTGEAKRIMKGVYEYEAN